MGSHYVVYPSPPRYGHIVHCQEAEEGGQAELTKTWYVQHMAKTTKSSGQTPALWAHGSQNGGEMELTFFLAHGESLLCFTKYVCFNKYALEQTRRAAQRDEFFHIRS